jgi:hypothetical protein
MTIAASLLASVILWCGQAFAPCGAAGDGCSGDSHCYRGKLDDQEIATCALECKTDVDCPVVDGIETECFDDAGSYGCFVPCETAADCLAEGALCDGERCLWAVAG